MLTNNSLVLRQNKPLKVYWQGIKNSMQKVCKCVIAGKSRAEITEMDGLSLYACELRSV